MDGWDADVEVLVGEEELSHPAHSQILAHSSPVFAAMLRHGMEEGRSRRIKLPDKAVEEWQVFYAFLEPVAGRRRQISVENVDFLLEWFDEYQIDLLMEDCETFLLSEPVTVDRLLQAKKFKLGKQYARCLEHVGVHFMNFPIEDVVDHPEIMRDLILLMKDRTQDFRNHVFREIEETAERCYKLIPREAKSLSNVALRADAEVNALILNMKTKLESSYVEPETNEETCREL
jgi:hypothetical protein